MRATFFLFITLSYHQYIKAQILDCDSPIYCQGELLDVVQRAHIYNDSKTFVDLVQKYSPNITLENFQKLLAATSNNPTQQDVLNFVNENFQSDVELQSWIPHDYQENPEVLTKINDGAVRSFAQSLVQIWPTLARKVNDSVFEEPERHSLIPVPNGFIIPGGRFKEIYYWDTYWILKGLLISGMTDTARGILDNFILLVQKYGFIPNGSRIYYLNRSEPPLLSLMVSLYINATNNITWLEDKIDTIEQELYWWLENRTVTVQKVGKNYTLAQYSCKSGTPRPESYLEDIVTCGSFEEDQKEKCYKNIKSAAEAGWDFSSRWLVDSDGFISTNLSLINTTRLIPVDLNAFLSSAFGELANFHTLLGNNQKADEWKLKEKIWQNAILAVLYNDEDNIWYDWDLKLSRHRKEFYPSNLAPLWAKAYDPRLKDQYGRDAVTYLNNNNILSFLGGTPTSLIQSGQQWDLPNAWPPLQEIVALGLIYTENEQAVEIGKLLAHRTLTAYMTGFNYTQEMFEKYDAIVIGEYGGGGEYTIQSGFGWTNGVALSFIELLYVN